MDAAAQIDVQDHAREKTGHRPPGKRPDRARLLRILRNVLIAIVALVFAAWLVLFITKGRFLKHPFERIASSAAGRQVRVGGDFQLYFAPLRIKFLADGLSVSNPEWAGRPQMFAARHIEARIAPLSLLFGRRHVHTLDLQGGAVDLEWDKAHGRNSWTFGNGGGGKPFEFPRIDRATISDTRVRYLDPQMPLLANLVVDPVTSTHARIGKAVSLRGDGTLRSTPFRVSARLLSPDATVNRGSNALELTAWAANN
jgi:uncharacterized protein involved in outer membrane biogenesis